MDYRSRKRTLPVPPHFVRPGDDGRNSTASSRKWLDRLKRKVNDGKRHSRKPR